MATLREIRQRISGVKSTQKITKAMKMVAAAKLRRAQDAITAARPYARTMQKILSNLSEVVEGDQYPLMQERDVARVAVIVVTADRGLCGAFNSNIIKAAREHVRTTYGAYLEKEDGVRLFLLGKKGVDSFSKMEIPIGAKHPGIFADLRFQRAQTVAEELVGMFLRGEVDRVDVIYNEFKNVAQQNIRVNQFLPIPQLEKAQGSAPGQPAEYIYEPSSAEILEELLPKHVNFQLWSILLESNAAEQGARMTAMANATENAKEMIRLLTLSYNKARQAGITKELLEIVSGAEALKKAG
jgi:F-type H+-transporting ATPase subunit gamma